MGHTRDPAFIDIDSEAGNSASDEGGRSNTSGVHFSAPVRDEAAGASAAPAVSDRIAELERLLGEKGDLVEGLIGAVVERDATIHALKLEVRDLSANRCDLVAQRAARLLGGAPAPNLAHFRGQLERALVTVERLEDWIHRSEHALANQGSKG